MKKLITLIALGSMILTGSAFAQGDGTGNDAPVRDRDRIMDGKFHIPRVLRSDEEIQECIAEYRVTREQIRKTLQNARAAYAEATEEQQESIKQRVRNYLKDQRKEQREFRRKVRERVRELREERANADTGTEG